MERPRISLSSELQHAFLGEIGRHIEAARAEALLELAEVKAARDDLAEELERKVGELETTTAKQTGAIVQLRADVASSAKRIGELSRDVARADLQLEQLGPLHATVSDLRERLQAEQNLRLAAEKSFSLLEQAAAHQAIVRLQLEARLAEQQDALKTSQRLAEQLIAKGSNRA